MSELSRLEHRIADALREAGARGWLHARPVHEGTDEPGHLPQEVSVGADHEVPMASLYKVILAMAWARCVDQGRLGPTDRLTVPAGARTPGPTGLSALRDDVTLSQRDLVTLMLTVSDNTAAEVLLGLVGTAQVRRVIADADLRATTFHGGDRELQRLVLEETGAPGFPEALRLLADRPGQDASAVYDPALSSTTTPRDMTSLLSAVWRDELASAEMSAVVRETMARQPWRHRLAAGFPHDDVVVAGKTGSLLALRHEAGVVTFPGEEPIAVAVLTHAINPAQHLPRVDAVIGEVGSLAVRSLRRVAER